MLLLGAALPLCPGMGRLIFALLPVVAIWCAHTLSGLRPEAISLMGSGPAEAAAWVLWTAVDLRWPITIICLIAAAVSFVTIVESHQATQKDPTRMFSSSQRTEGFARAGNICELERWPFIRCTRPASHGDHFFPWSLGGCSNMANFVAACAPCNLAKSNKYPSRFLRWRIERRRRRYFPPGMPVTAGDRMLSHR